MKQTSTTALSRALLAMVFILSCGFAGTAWSEATERLQQAVGETTPEPQAASRASLSVTRITDGATAQQMVDDLLGMPIVWVETANATFTGAARAGGTFTDPLGAIGIAQGAIISTGNAILVIGGASVAQGGRGVNTTCRASANNGLGGDDDVAVLTGGLTRDRAFLQFDVRSTHATWWRALCLRFVMGSEEHVEYPPSVFNDGFGIFIWPTAGGEPAAGTKQNYALIPRWPLVPAGPPTPAWRAVTVNNVRQGSPWPNKWYFTDNDHPPAHPFDKFRDTELDGLTQWGGWLLGPPWNLPIPAIPIRAVPLPMAPNVWYTVKIAIADGQDRVWDSDAFVGAGSPGIIAGACHECDANVFSCDEVADPADCTTGTFVEAVYCIDIVPPCDVTGACDFFNSDSCVVTTQEVCWNANGMYAGDDTDCIGTGSCCVEGNCQVTASGNCDTLQGSFSAGGDCSVTGACQDGEVCTDGSTADCCTGSFTPGATCDFPGVCCQDGGVTCTTETQSVCEAAGGVYKGAGTSCVSGACGGGRIPAVSEWGLIVMTLLLLTVGTIVIGRQRRTAAA